VGWFRFPAPRISCQDRFSLLLTERFGSLLVSCLQENRQALAARWWSRQNLRPPFEGMSMNFCFFFQHTVSLPVNILVKLVAPFNYSGLVDTHILAAGGP
jgi:hypothetical protein